MRTWVRTPETHPGAMLEFGPLGSGPGHEGLDSGNLGSGSSGWEESLDLDWLTGKASLCMVIRISFNDVSLC